MPKAENRRAQGLSTCSPKLQQRSRNNAKNAEPAGTRLEPKLATSCSRIAENIAKSGQSSPKPAMHSEAKSSVGFTGTLADTLPMPLPIPRGGPGREKNVGSDPISQNGDSTTCPRSLAS